MPKGRIQLRLAADAQEILDYYGRDNEVRYHATPEQHQTYLRRPTRTEIIEQGLRMWAEAKAGAGISGRYLEPLRVGESIRGGLGPIEPGKQAGLDETLSPTRERSSLSEGIRSGVLSVTRIGSTDEAEQNSLSPESKAAREVGKAEKRERKAKLQEAVRSIRPEGVLGTLGTLLPRGSHPNEGIASPNAVAFRGSFPKPGKGK